MGKLIECRGCKKIRDESWMKRGLFCQWCRWQAGEFIWFARWLILNKTETE